MEGEINSLNINSKSTMNYDMSNNIANHNNANNYNEEINEEELNNEMYAQNNSINPNNFFAYSLEEDYKNNTNLYDERGYLCENVEYNPSENFNMVVQAHDIYNICKEEGFVEEVPYEEDYFAKNQESYLRKLGEYISKSGNKPKTSYELLKEQMNRKFNKNENNKNVDNVNFN